MATLTSPQKTAALPRIPDRIRVLYVTTLHRTGSWLTEAFAADSASKVHLTEVVGVTAGLAMLREEVFDAILASHEPGVLDALDFVEGLRTGGHDEPVILLGSEPPEVFESLAYEVGADAYCSIEQTTTRSLLWEFARAIRRFELVRENRRLVEAERQRLASEHTEAERLLAEQRALLHDLETLDTENLNSNKLDSEVGTARSLAMATQLTGRGRSQLPAALVQHYRDMLQTYVVMGSGNLGHEMTRLTDLFITAGISAQQAMQLHVEVLEGMIQGLGRRSARHVMNRADLLGLEVMVHLADGYRQQLNDRRFPPEQQLLPGIDPADIYSPQQPTLRSTRLDSQRDWSQRDWRSPAG